MEEVKLMENEEESIEEFHDDEDFDKELDDESDDEDAEELFRQNPLRAIFVRQDEILDRQGEILEALDES